MPKLRVKDLQALLEDSKRDNQALEQRLLDMEALIKSLQSGTRPQETIPLNLSPSPHTQHKSYYKRPYNDSDC